MVNDDRGSSRPRLLGPIAHVGGRAATFTLRPVKGAVNAAVEAGASVERQVVDRVLDSREIERIVIAALGDARIQAAVRRALDTEGAKQLIDTFFDSGLFDRLMERVAESPALWRLIDEVAGSPAVLAAVSQQSLGFADQVGEVLRGRSRQADQLVARTAGRFRHRQPAPVPTPDAHT
jgi:hypothetical protein